jgi:hypothetical protein
MNKRKKLLCVFLLAAFLFCYTSLNVFAEGDSTAQTNQPSTTQNDTSPAGDSTTGGSTGAAGDSGQQEAQQTAGENPTQPSDTQQAASVNSAPPKPASSAAPSSQASKASSKKKRRAVSSAVSSAPESQMFTGFAESSEFVSSDVISLPEAGIVSENDPLASVSQGTPSKQINRIGILAWVCIALGVLVVLIVIFSNRRPPRGPGRSRYHRPRRGNRKHLLNDKYYRDLNRY